MPRSNEERYYEGLISRHNRNDRWRFRLEETYILAETIRECRKIDEICQCLLKFFQRYGATSLLAGMIPPLKSSSRAQVSHVLLDNWPKEWSRRYFSHGYLYRDPAIRLVQQGRSHFHWNEIGDLCSICPVGRRVINEASEFHLRQGLTFSFPMLKASPFGFSIAAEKLELDDSDHFTLQFIAAYGLGCAITLAGGQIGGRTVHLSQRQREVVAWASEGLTVDEVAARMNISVHTVDMHLRGARARLGVANTVQAVAEALRLGLIS